MYVGIYMHNYVCNNVCNYRLFFHSYDNCNHNYAIITNVITIMLHQPFYTLLYMLT